MCGDLVPTCQGLSKKPPSIFNVRCLAYKNDHQDGKNALWILRKQWSLGWLHSTLKSRCLLQVETWWATLFTSSSLSAFERKQRRMIFFNIFSLVFLHYRRRRWCAISQTLSVEILLMLNGWMSAPKPKLSKRFNIVSSVKKDIPLNLLLNILVQLSFYMKFKTF